MGDIIKRKSGELPPYKRSTVKLRSMTCIAGPIYDKEGTIIASLSVSRPTTRIRHKGVEEVTERIKIICETVSNKIKYERYEI